MATVEEQTTPLTRDELFEVLWPGLDRHAYLEAAGMNGRDWFRHYQSGWRQLGAFKFGQEPGFERLSTLAGGTDLSFAAVLRSQPAANAALLPLRFLWCGIVLRVEGKRLHDAGLRLVPGEAEAARARLVASPVRPGILLDEGHRVTAIWLLEQGMAVPQARLLLTRLAARHGGDRELADPDRAMLALPGATVSTLFPRFAVRVEASQPPRRVTVEELEQWLA